MLGEEARKKGGKVNKEGAVANPNNEIQNRASEGPTTPANNNKQIKLRDENIKNEKKNKD